MNIIQENRYVNFVFWSLIHSFSIWLITLILQNKAITDYWIVLIGTGIGITIVAGGIRSLLFHRAFHLNGTGLFWLVIHIVGFWIFKDLLLPITGLTGHILTVLFLGFGIQLTAQIAQYSESGRSNHRSGINFHFAFSGLRTIILVLLLIAGIWVVFIDGRFAMVANVCSDPLSMGLAGGLSGMSLEQTLQGCQLGNLMYYGGWAALLLSGYFLFFRR